MVAVPMAQTGLRFCPHAMMSEMAWLLNQAARWFTVSAVYITLEPQKKYIRREPCNYLIYF